MTQSEYEQKRTECWEEFCKDPHLCDSHSLTKSTFNFAFDRAYAIGREKETITQEEIYNQFKEKLYNNDFLADKNNPSFVDRYIEYTKVYKWVVNALGKQEKDADTVIQGWVARDSDGTLSLFAVKPERVRYRRRNGGLWMAKTMTDLNSELFPDLTWESEPIKVSISIKRE